MTRNALVLGGGGALGIAWEVGVLSGLLEEGIDTTGAQLIVGTSAGSVVGTQLAVGETLEELLAEQSGSGRRRDRAANPDRSAGDAADLHALGGNSGSDAGRAP